MTCDTALELIGPYLDDDLAAETRRRVEAHLMRCPICAWETQTLRITQERLREHVSGEVVASDAFRSRVLQRLRAEHPQLNPSTTGEESAAAEQFRLPLPFS